MNAVPSISVVIPCFNGERFLAETLRSVLAQTKIPLEIIVVDDGSTDNSAVLAESFGSIVRVVRQENRGLPATRNRGIGESRGDWIAFLDADDLWLPEKLERQVAATTEQTGAVICGSIVSSKIPPDESAEIWKPTHETLKPEVLLHRQSMIQPSGFMVRRTTTTRFAEWSIASEDVMYMLDITRETKVAICEEPLLIYRVHPQSLCRISRDRDCMSHSALSKWVEMHRTELGESDCERHHRTLSEMLLNCGMNAVYKRNWPRLEVIQSYARGLSNLCTKEAVLRLRRYPKAAYHARDFMRRLTGGTSTRSVAQY